MQITVENSMLKGLEGSIATLGNVDIKSYVNNSKQLSQVTIVSGGTGTVHSIVVDGTTYSYTELAFQSAANIATALIAVINTGGEAVTIVDNADGTFTMQANVAGTAFTLTTTASTVTIDHLIENNQTIPFGRFLTQDNETGQDQKCHLPYTSAQITGSRALGFSVHDHAHEQAITNADNPGYPAQHPISVLRKGEILVRVEEAVTPASVPHIRFSAGTYSNLGAVRASVDSGTAAPLSIARFTDSANALSLATLEINWP